MRRLLGWFLLVGVSGCGGDEKAGPSVEGPELDIARCAPGGAFSTTITNRFFPMPVGRKATYVDPEGTRIEITVLAETEVVAGVTTRVLHEYETEDDVLVEQSWNYFAQAADGTVCYFGERVDIYDASGTQVVAHDGQWRADEAGFAPGIQMPAVPEVGTYHKQEHAPGVAEDYADIVELGKQVTVPQGAYSDTLITSEWTPLEPGHRSAKSYAAGVGLLDDSGSVLTAIETP